MSGIATSDDALLFPKIVWDRVLMPDNTNQEKTSMLATLKPTTLLAMFHLPQLKGVAQEVEDTLVKIMKETA